MKKYLVSLCAAVVLIVAAAPANAAIINGGFEMGLPSWTSTPASSFTATSTSAFGHTAFAGHEFAYLLTNGSPGNYTTLSQTFIANAGDILTFNAFFQSDEVLNSPKNDNGYVRIINNSDSTFVTLYSADVTVVGGGNSTPWTPGTSSVLSASSYTIEAGVRNFFDNTGQSVLGLDNVVLSDGSPASAVPEPATMTMLGIGVAGMFGFGLRRRRANTEATPA